LEYLDAYRNEQLCDHDMIFEILSHGTRNDQVWCGTPKARNKIPNFQNPKAFILEGLDKN